MRVSAETMVSKRERHSAALARAAVMICVGFAPLKNRCAKSLWRWSRQRRHERSRARVVSEGLADVCEAIDIAGPEYETTAKLERILAQLVLLMAGFASAFSALHIVSAQEMEKICGFQFHGVIRLTNFIDEQGKGDPGLLAEFPGVYRVTKPDGGKDRSLLANGRLVFAQLRYMFAAEDSAVMTQEDHHRWLLVP